MWWQRVFLRHAFIWTVRLVQLCCSVCSVLTFEIKRLLQGHCCRVDHRTSPDCRGTWHCLWPRWLCRWSWRPAAATSEAQEGACYHIQNNRPGNGTERKRGFSRVLPADLYEFRFSHQQHAEHSLDVGTLELLQEVVEAGHSLFPVVQLGSGAEVVRLLPQLVALG